ncbi:MAG: class I SAM-dependent methyltransferase [Gammaproteobacteria bacterium]|jgi:ubiquinone/menaquinone biosynthesis C-methylase UbiE
MDGRSPQDRAAQDGGMLAALYRPGHDEAARQRFVGALKTYANGPLEGLLAARYESTLRPAFERAHGRAPGGRDEARPLFEADPLYQLWGAMVFASQGLMWQAVGETCRRIAPAAEARAAALLRGPRGSLRLDPALRPPEPIASTEIHRQPGGYFAEPRPDDLMTALLYFGTIELYRTAKGMAAAGGGVGVPGIGRYMVGVLKRRHPDLRPRRILDLGCGTGVDTLAWAEAFPDAEVHGVDLSGPLLRFAHAWAEDRGHAVHFRQANACATGLPDGHFDLIVSHILFHETWHDLVGPIFAEAHRLLAPGGLFFNADVPYQPAQIPVTKQVTNDWQVRNNGEPFWTGFADTDVAALLRAAGFAPEAVYADYEPLGAGKYFFFGGRRAAGGGAG